MDAAKATGGAVHLLGLLSPGGVHSHEDHILAMAQAAAARGAERVYIHAFLDGRDTPPRSAGPSLEAADEALKGLGVGRVASIVGRYYAMDRDKRWDRGWPRPMHSLRNARGAGPPAQRRPSPRPMPATNRTNSWTRPGAAAPRAPSAMGTR